MSALLPPRYVKVPVKLLTMDLPPVCLVTALKLYALCWRSPGRSTPELDLNWLKEYLCLGDTQYYGHMAALKKHLVLSWTNVRRGTLVVTFADWLDGESREGGSQIIASSGASSIEGSEFALPSPMSGFPQSPGRRNDSFEPDCKPPANLDSLNSMGIRNPGQKGFQPGKSDRSRTAENRGCPERISWREALSDEIVDELRDTGVFEAVFQRVADSGWSDWQIRKVLHEVRQVSSTPGALFVYRLTHSMPPVEPGSESDRQRYVSGPYAEFVNH